MATGYLKTLTQPIIHIQPENTEQHHQCTAQLRHHACHKTQERAQPHFAGSVRLAAPTGLVNAAAFQHALRRIRREHPALSLELHFGEAIAELREGSIDIALRGGGHALDEPDLVARRLHAPLIRINPDEAQVGQEHHIGLAMGGLAALQEIAAFL